jgi:hypothetical protein
MTKLGHDYHYGLFHSDKRLSTKANVLEFLEATVKNSHVEKIFVFNVKEWKKQKDEILNKISNYFGLSNVIVRSSAIGEDSIKKSEAGNYTSILNVDSSSTNQLIAAIDNVVLSYHNKKNYNTNNQILIQKQTEDIETSGVIFTRTSDIAAPYYVINYEDGSATDNVTKGFSDNIIKIFRDIDTHQIPQKWLSLIKAVKEIEQILHTSFLDIEFGIKKDKQVVIFQVRPLTSSPTKYFDSYSDARILKLIKINKKRFVELQKKIYSDMSDWNPAEIIGNNPNPLDYSLYNYLFMKDSWRIGRSKIGYQDMEKYHLMEKFGNKPYVDLYGSFNSLLPSTMSCILKKKLIEFYFNKLSKLPNLHDKVEFEILFSCYDFNVEKRLAELRDYGFGTAELDKIKFILIDFTNDIINRFPSLVTKFDSDISKMSENRKTILTKIRNNNDPKQLLYFAKKFLKDCKTLGAYNFVIMARIAFIGTALLKSLHTSDHVKKEFVDDFMRSITTPLSEIQIDLELLKNNKLTKNEFLKKYGHLRPGTYDITATRYDKNKIIIHDIKHFKFKERPTPQLELPNIESILERHGLRFQSINFFDFVSQSIIKRETIKFEFTKNLSAALELIAKAGFILGFSREDMSYLSLSEIYKNYDRFILKKYWKKKIIKNKNKKQLNNYLSLPPIIFSEDDFEIIQHYISKPNFITTNVVTANLKLLENVHNAIDIDKHIVLIENADPGYDWIFTANPSGLITKYGGIASHMAIRCAEVGLPAAIGCGEILYEKLSNSKKINLDCHNQQIIILQNEKIDEHMEEKKILKTLGYIK